MQTRDLTLLTPSPSNSISGTPLGPSPHLAPLAEGTDGVTPQHYPQQGEQASVAAGVLDAQPAASLTAANLIAKATEGRADSFNGPRQATVYPTTGGWILPSSSTSVAQELQGSHSLGELLAQTPLGIQAETSMTAGMTGRDSFWSRGASPLDCMPNEILTHILGFLDVSDLLATSRVSCQTFWKIFLLRDVAGIRCHCCRQEPCYPYVM